MKMFKTILIIMVLLMSTLVYAVGDITTQSIEIPTCQHGAIQYDDETIDYYAGGKKFEVYTHIEAEDNWASFKVNGGFGRKGTYFSEQWGNPIFPGGSIIINGLEITVYGVGYEQGEEYVTFCYDAVDTEEGVADLAIQYINIKEQNQIDDAGNRLITVTALVKNIGNRESGTYDVTLYADGRFMNRGNGYHSLVPEEVEGPENVGGGNYYSTGWHTVRLVISPHGDDLNSENNVLTEKFYVDAATRCTESDGGIDIYERGKGTICKSGGCETFNDYCAINLRYSNGEVSSYTPIGSCNGKGCYIDERYCAGGEMKYIVERCLNGCEDGACVEGSVACSMPECNYGEAYKTGETYSNGCPIYKCPQEPVSCEIHIDRFNCEITECSDGTVSERCPTDNAIYWKGYKWKPVYGEIGRDSGYGNWYVAENLVQDHTSSLHPRLLNVEMDNLEDYEVYTRLRFRRGTEGGVCVRMDENGNGYCFSTAWGGGDNTMISRFINNDQNPGHIKSGNYFPINTNADYNVRVRAEGNTIKGKIWRDGTREPESWTAEGTDYRFGKGKVGFYTYGSEVEFKDLEINDIVSACTSYVDIEGCTITKCGGVKTRDCPITECKSYVDENGCTVTTCRDGKTMVDCPGEYVGLNEKFVLVREQSVKVKDYGYMKVRLVDIDYPTAYVIVEMGGDCEEESGDPTCSGGEIKVDLGTGQSEEVFGAKLSLLDLSDEKGLFVVQKPNFIEGDVDIEIYPEEQTIGYGDKAVYTVRISDKHTLPDYCLNPGPNKPACAIAEYTYYIDVRNLPFFKDYPKQIHLGPGESQTFELVVSPYVIDEKPTVAGGGGGSGITGSVVQELRKYVARTSKMEQIQAVPEDVTESMEQIAEGEMATETIESVEETAIEEVETGEEPVESRLYRSYKFNVRVKQQNDPKNQDVAYAMLQIKPENPPIPPPFPGETVKIRLNKGWNMISLPGKLIKFEKLGPEEDKPGFKLVGFVYLKEEQRYITMQEAQQILGDRFGEYLARNAFWVYSYNERNLIARIDREISYNDIELRTGWNLVPITEDMVGGYLSDIKGDCDFEKLYIWDSLNQQWRKIAEDYSFSGNQINQGFLVRVNEDCRLGGVTIALTPPPMPE